MPRHLALLLCALPILLAGAPRAGAAEQAFGPTAILYADADTVYFLRSLQWHSANARHQEKLLLHGLRMRYWRDHLPGDMRRVFDALGYPVGRVRLDPAAGAGEEWWYYGILDPPLRFRAGTLIDADRFERYRLR